MATIWDPSLRSAFAARAARLAQGTVPGWGKMNAGGMMAHLNDSYRMALGELTVKPRNVPFRYPVIKQLIVYAR